MRGIARDLDRFAVFDGNQDTAGIGTIMWTRGVHNLLHDFNYRACFRVASDFTGTREDYFRHKDTTDRTGLKQVPLDFLCPVCLSGELPLAGFRRVQIIVQRHFEIHQLVPRRIPYPGEIKPGSMQRV